VKLQFNAEQLAKLSGPDRNRAAAFLGTYKGAIESNPLWAYFPHEKQIAFHESRVPIRCFAGGNRSGKSTGNVADALIQLLDEESLPPWLRIYKHREPPTFIRFMTPDFTTTGEGVIVELFRSLTPTDQLRNHRWDRSYETRRRRLTFENGSWVEFLSYEQELNKMGGAALHSVRLDEEPPDLHGRAIFIENQMRLIDYGGDLAFSMTPLNGLTWSYDLLTKDGVPRNDDEVFVVTVDMDDNPYLDAKAKEATLMGLSKEELEMRKSGKWVHIAGLIYDEFKLSEHVIPEVDEVPEGAEVYVGIDPGLREMAAVVFAYVTADDVLVVFEEIAEQNTTVAQICSLIFAVNAKYKIEPKWYVIDPAARNRNHQTGRSDQMEYIDHGIVTMPGQNARRAGFDNVKERLRNDPPRLLFTANCETTISQMRRYRWRSDPRGESSAREEPIKRDDHCIDALLGSATSP